MNVPKNSVSQIAADRQEKAASLVNKTGFSSARLVSRFFKYYLVTLVCQLLPDSRITKCGKLIIPGRNGVEVWYSDERKRARLGNLCVCGLIWICPVCASRISEQRSRMLKAGMDGAHVVPLLITFTMSHGYRQRLKPNLEALTDAYKDLTHGRAWVGFAERYGWLTSVRALEVTHGENGWHPHLHVLAFLKQPLHYDEAFMFDIQLSDMWRGQLARRGASASAERGVDVRTANKDAAAYVAKFGREPLLSADGKSAWGIERELTKAVVKNARWNGRTPWALLSDYGQGDQQAGALFVEYSEAFRNHKQLVIPPAARELLGIDDVPDAELADAPLSEVERLLWRLTIDQWKRVLYADQLEGLMQIADSGDARILEAWLHTTGVM